MILIEKINNNNQFFSLVFYFTPKNLNLLYDFYYFRRQKFKFLYEKLQNVINYRDIMILLYRKTGYMLHSISNYARSSMYKNRFKLCFQ